MSAVAAAQRLARLRSVMAELGVGSVFTADPINLLYASGVRNMTVFSMMGPSRFALVTADRVTVWEYGGSEHLAADSMADEVLAAPAISPVFDPGHQLGVSALVGQIVDRLPEGATLAVERIEFEVIDALRAKAVQLSSATEVFVAARVRKTPAEIDLMRHSMAVTTTAVEQTRAALEPGRTEVEVWAEFHRSLIASDGEYVSTRLAQSGPRTFPYFQEASTRVIEPGDLFCLDTDAIGPASYAADFSRTWCCGAAPTEVQRRLHATAARQLRHNSALLEPGRSFRSFAAEAWQLPDEHRAYGYSCLAHGLGLCGEYPYIPTVGDGPWTFDGTFEPGMVLCIESYVGSPEAGQGVKLEDQFLVTEDGVERMSALDLALTMDPSEGD